MSDRIPPGDYWAKLKGSLHRSQERWEVDLDGLGLWTICVSFVADHLTDGYVPEAFVKANVPRPDRRGVLSRVLASGLLYRTSGGFLVNEYLDHNQSRAEILHIKETRADAGRQGGNAKANALANATADATAIGVAGALQEVRSKEEEDKSSSKGQVRKVFDEWVTATERDTARTKLTSQRQGVIKRALASHGAADCLAAVRNIGASADARNGYGRGTRYDDISHALSDAGRIERWRDSSPGLRVVAGSPHPGWPAWCSEHFPGADPTAVRVVWNHTRDRLLDLEDPDRLRRYVELQPNFAYLLQSPEEGAA